MKHRTLTYMCAIGAAALVSLPAIAQNNSQNNNAYSLENKLGNPEPIHRINGKEVMSSDNQKIGKIDNVIVDLESGRALYVRAKVESSS